MGIKNQEFNVLPISLYQSIQIILHRADMFHKKYPENNLEGIINWYDEGIRNFEVDLFCTKDQEIILLHPSEKDYRRGPIGFPQNLDITKMSLADFQETSIEKEGSYFSITTLQELFNASKMMPGIKFYLEPKNGNLDVIVNNIIDNGMSDRSVILTDRQDWLKEAKDYSKCRVLTNYIVKNPFFSLKKLFQFDEITFGFDRQGYLINQFYLRPNIEKTIEKLKEKEIKVMTGWTNMVKDVYWSINLELDGVFTDYPNMAKKAIQIYPY